MLDDPAFAANLSRLGPDSTIAAFAHAGRCVEIAKQFVPPRDLAEVEPWLGVLDQTVASMVLTHSGEVFRFSAMVAGMPDVGDLVTQLIHEEVGTARVGRQSPDMDDLLEEFRTLAVGQEDHAAAVAVGELILKEAHDAAGPLNNFAWALLTEQQYEDRFDELALRLSERSNEISGHRVWQYVDTLAWAKFKTGDAQAAAELEKKALALCDDEGGTAELKKALAEFEAALDRPTVLQRTPR
jgi:hypothetical protein